MAENNEGEGISQKGNEWEVVALTESAYAAAPGPRNILDNIDSNSSGDVDSETAHAMFMSGHFGLSPSVHDNFPLEPEYKEKYSGVGIDLDVHQVMVQQGGKSVLKQEENLNIEGLIPDEFSGVPQYDEKYKNLSLSDLGDVASSKLIDREQGLYMAGKLSSYDDAAAAAGMPFADEGSGSAEAFESVDDAVNAEDDKFSEPSSLPCEAWWRRHADSLYGQAKSANPYWSLVVAAAVIGLVIIGRRWQRDRPQVFQLKSQLTLDNKGSHWILSPMTRLKDVTLGARHSSYMGVSSLTEEMGKDDSPQVSRRATRSSSNTTPNSKVSQEASKATDLLQPLTIKDLVFHGKSINLDELINLFPGRRAQILELIKFLGPLNSPMIPLFAYGGASTGKTSIILSIFRHMKRPLIYCSCVSCYNPRILFESILNQLLLHRKNESGGYSSAKRCEKPSDFVNLLRETLTSLIDSLKKNTGKSSSKKSSSQVNGRMVYLIFDNLELVRDWDKSDTIIPLLFNLHNILKISEVGLIFISRASLDTFPSDTGFVEPFPVYFPDYTEDDLLQIFMRNQANPKLYSSFLDLVLRPFYRITRQVDELSTAFSPLFKKYCEPLGDLVNVPSEDMKRKLFSHLQPFISLSLNETFTISSQSLFKATANKDRNMRKSVTRKPGVYETLDEIDFHMSTSAKYLLISAFLASRNPATLDASLFDSTGGSDNRKRKRKVSEKSIDQKEMKEQELVMKGPGTFPLERLLAIYQCIASVGEYLVDDEEQTDGLGDDGFDNGSMSDILLQLSSLCSANFITKGGSCPLEGSTRYRSIVSEDMVLKVARSLKFPLSKYLYRR
ncbi:origin recognition complex protein 5 [Perilla frutescens var. frutescens]|nr:origin recognition complex protein 5 [Perilla frutescens var. frutescens]